MAHDLFISYEKSDRPVVDYICAALERHGVRCWYAPRDLPAGSNDALAIIRALRECRLLLLVHSRAANHSALVQREVERATSLGIPILPLRTENLPYSEEFEFFLSKIPSLDAFLHPFDRNVKAIIAGVTARLAHAPLPVASCAPRPTPATLAPQADTHEQDGTTKAMRIGDYPIVRHLERWLWGRRFVCRHPKTRREVHVTVSDRHLASEERKQQVVNGLRTLCALHHPNVVTVLDAGLHQGHVFFVTEPVEGTPLLEYLERGPMRLSTILDWMARLCDALACAHTMQIVHGAVSPATLVVDAEGGVKLCGFAPPGLATLVSEWNPWGYLSPEQVRDEPADHRSDIFAVGAVFYLLVARRNAFPSDEIPKFQTDPPPPLDAVCPRLEPEIVRIVDRALDKNPFRRSVDMQAMRDETRAAIKKVRAEGTDRVVEAAPAAGAAPAGDAQPGSVPGWVCLPADDPRTAACITPEQLRRLGFDVPSAPPPAPGRPSGSTDPAPRRNRVSDPSTRGRE
jgi:hypothetical protein